LGALCTLCFRPRRSASHPPYCENHLKVKGKIRQKRGKGDIPLVCLPLWGREGVTLIAFPKYKKMGSDRISPERENILVFSPV